MSFFNDLFGFELFPYTNPLPPYRRAGVPGLRDVLSGRATKVSKQIAYQGVVREGPLKGQTLAQTSPKRDIQGGSGFYIYMASRNGEVPYWRWVPKRSEADK